MEVDRLVPMLTDFAYAEPGCATPDRCVPAKVKALNDLLVEPFGGEPNGRADSYPYDMFAVPLDDVVRIHASSGTTG
jgi:phenylacetate-coenzyme A ligase PaaK-like adenylate-forming protein